MRLHSHHSHYLPLILAFVPLVLASCGPDSPTTSPSQPSPKVWVEPRDKTEEIPYPLELPALLGMTYQKLAYKTLSLDLEEAGLSEIFDAISMQSDVEISTASDISPAVLDKKITIQSNNKSGYEVLLLLVSQSGLSFQCDSQGRIRIVEGPCKVEYIRSLYRSFTIESPEFTPFGPKVRTLQMLEAARRDLLKDDREIEKGEKTTWESFNQIKVNLEVTDQPLSDVIEFLRQFTNLCCVFDLDIDQTKKVTYKSQNKSLGMFLQEILGVDLAVIYSGTHPEVQITSTEKAKQILEERSRDQASRESRLAMTVSTKGSNLTAVFDRLRRLDHLPINPDREVWENGKSITLDGDGQPLKDFLDRATSQLGAKWLYCKGSIYVYMPIPKIVK